jgi:large subunit ribosomal protein L32
MVLPGDTLSTWYLFNVVRIRRIWRQFFTAFGAYQGYRTAICSCARSCVRTVEYPLVLEQFVRCQRLGAPSAADDDAKQVLNVSFALGFLIGYCTCQRVVDGYSTGLLISHPRVVCQTEATMAVQQHRVSRMKCRRRKSANRYKGIQTNVCPNCSAKRLSHRACPKCGHYKDRQVLTIAAE